MSLSNEQLLYLSALAYYNIDNLNKDNTMGKIIENSKKKENTTCFDGAAGYTDKELGMDKIISFIENDSELMKLQMVYPSGSDNTTSSVCFVNIETSEVYVVYCGNYIAGNYEYKDENGNINSNSTWISNMKGAVECDTVEQKLAVEFYNNAISAARNVLNNVDGDIDITVCGHSTGGNQAQYVTIAYEKSQGENYSQNNDVDRCVSFDGQGFSNEFITKYYNDIQKRSNKITSYEPTLSYVGSLLNSIPGARRKYIHLGNTEAFGIGIHMPAEMLDENGGFKKEEEYTSAISRILNNISKEAVAITDGIPGIDVDNACEKIGQFITKITGGDIDEDAIGDSIKNLLTSKDVIALLIAGTVTTDYEISSGELTIGKDAFIKNIEAYRNTLVNATELFKSGEYVEALLESYYGFSRNMFNDNIIQSILQHADVISYVAVPLGKQICKLYEKFDKSIGISLIKKFKWKSIKHLFGWLDKSYRQASASVRYISDPLVIDLDGDGFELTDVENGVYFDNDNYGLSEKTQWVSSDDGLLAIDLNGDGIINDGSELFGSSTVMLDGSIARLGFEALAQYDENGDGIIDEKDSAYYRLLVWQDNNRNGISEANELKTLKELGIESISLKAEEIDGVNTAYIKYFDGRKRKIGEFSFDSESYNTIEKESERISEDIEKMPDVNAIGNVASLHTLMQKDTTGRLAEYVNLFAKSDNDNEKSEIITKILYFITGADNISGGSRGGNIDAKKLRVIEMFMGRNFIGTEGSNPVNTAADILNGLYNNIHELYYNLLNAETKLKDYMEMVFIENDDYINTEIFDTYMSICISEGIDVKGIIKDMGRYIAVMNDNQINLVNYIQKYIEYPEIITELKNVIPSNLIVGSNESDTINISNNSNVTVIAGAGDDIINANDGNDLVYAGSGNDTVNGGDGDDTIYGGAGDDILNGEGENDKLYGGVGNDTLNGGYGDDTYYFELGDGEDTIYEDGEYVNVDRIVFGKGISPENISLERIGNDLVIKYSEVDKVTVKNAYGYKKYCGYGYYFVEKIEFSDGTVWNKDKLIELISIKTGTAENDVLTGYEGTDVYNRNETFYAGAGDDIINANDGNDLVYAGAGNDTVNGGDGDDTIYGGAGDDILNGEGENDKLYGGVGNDTLNGGYGDDTYYFELGDGEDTIYEDGEYVNVDRIVFGKGISPENISLERIGNDLVIKYSEVDKVTVKNAYGYKKYCGYGYYFVEKIEFSDGTVWNKDKLIELISIKTGTAENDVLTGYEGTDVYNRNETFYAGAGDDIINANDGNDLVYAGSGNDTVNGGDGDDTIYGGAGDDILNGEGENDKLYGGVGNDTLNGGYGDDTYYFELGDGEDTIYEDGEYVNVDRIVFGKGISPENISLERIGNDLVIKYSEVDKVTVKNAYGYKKYCGYGYYFVEKIEFSDGTVWNKDKLIELISIKTGTAENDVLTGYEGTDVYNRNETFYAGAGDDIINANDGNDLVYAGSGNDTVNGGDGDDTIYGGAGDDILNGEGENDKLYGGVGNDTLNGGYGDDTYYFELGDGEDTIYEDGEYVNVDRIVFGKGISPENISLERIGNDLVIKYSEVDKVTVKNAYGYKKYCGYGYYFVEKIEFSDGTVWNKDKLIELISIKTGTAGNDVLTGYEGTDVYNRNETFYAGAGDDIINANDGNDLVYAGSGNDTVNGGDGDDTIYGGAGDDILNGEGENDKLYGGVGNDTLNGGYGNDTYYFELGDGEDTIYEDGEYVNVDRIVFGKGISPENISLERIGNDLVIKYSEVDKVTVKNAYGYKKYCGYGYYFVEKIEFSDGTVWNKDKLIELISIKTGTAGNDVLTGYEGTDVYNRNETFYAGAGDDIINANDGNDLVYAGSGNDTVNGGDGDDTIYGGAGDDILNGEGENDKLYGGVGNDTLNGGYGDDTYYFELGDGEDTIYEDGEYVNVDRIVFGKGISPENISLERIGNDLVIKYSEVDKVTVKNAYGYKKYCGYGYYFVEKIEFSDGTVWNKDKLIELISIKTGTAENDVLTGYEGTDVYNRNETFYAGAGDDIINANDGNDLVYAGSGNDTVNGGDGDDTIYGGAGDDILNGEGENDKLYGGVGNDTLNGGYGNDTYYFELGDGEDTIYEDGEYVNVDRIVFGKGISPENISLERIGNDLVIKYSEVDKVTVKNAYGYKKYCGYGYYFVEKIEFSDGTVWNKDKLIELISIKTGTAGNDVLTGYEGTDVYNRNETFYAGAGDDIINANDGNDLVYAGSGNDTVNGGDGDDTIYGGAGDDILNGEGENDKLYGGVGNDTLNGGYGNDTYYFELGDGEDTIYEDGEYVNVDRIVFGKGINPSDVAIERVGNDIIIRYSATDRITIKNAYGYKKYCGYGYYFVEKIEFSDGTVWNKDKLIELISIKTGTAGNDVLTGYEGTDVYNINETFYGGVGNDTIYGGDGNDTYIFGRGDGIDTIVDNSGSNILSFEENISIEDLMMTKNGNNLEVSISDTTDKIILNDYFINSSYQNFTAEFADGSSLSQNDFSSIINGTYVYESALKQSELLVQSMASTSDDGNVSEMVNITTQDNNMTDTQLFVSNQ